MNVNGLPSSLQTLLNAREAQAMRPDAATGAANAQQTQRTGTAAPTQKPAAAAAAPAALGPKAPEGTDPALWSVLTSDERAFFSRVVTSGPLTYSKIAQARTTQTAMPAIRGGRIDIRA